MTTTLSKRHQARNERALQELIKTVPGNDRCADCGARNPGWASWSLGIFLCMRCASLHRKLGTHISKVKSLSMDSWSNDQVDSMKRNGNANTNRTFNPQNTKPPIPLDVDEVDAVLEKYIRQKYDQQLFSGGQRRTAMRHDTGSTRSSEDQPPPLPPKPGKRFGFGLRSASSALPLQRNLPASPPHSPSSFNGFGGPPSPLRVNKQSRVFGASVGGGGGEMEAKLTQLKDMGFNDERKNAQVLRGLNGNLERAIEALVRLGEGSAPTSRSRTPNPVRNVAVSQPLPPTPSAQSTGTVNGISFTNHGAIPQPSTGNQGNQSYQGLDSSGAQPSRNFTSPNLYQPQPQPQAQSYNPFETANQQNIDGPLQNAFQGMQITQQPLFPNTTGGYPSQPHPPQEARYQTMTPPVPQLPQQYLQNSPQTQQNPPPSQNYNPFYQTNQQAVSVSSNPYVTTSLDQTPQSPNIPYQEQALYQPFSNGYSTDSPQAYFPQVQPGPSHPSPFPQQAIHEQPQPMRQYNNPYATSNSFNDTPQHVVPNPPPQIPQYHQLPSQPSQSFDQYQAQPLQPQQTGKVDKSSILALYNYPQLAPPPLPVEQHATSSVESSAASLPPGMRLAQRSATMPVQMASGSRNPFQSATAQSSITNGSVPGSFGHASQEIVDVGGYQNGRHSPDAFASLSARFVR